MTQWVDVRGVFWEMIQISYSIVPLRHIRLHSCPTSDQPYLPTKEPAHEYSWIITGCTQHNRVNPPLLSAFQFISWPKRASSQNYNSCKWLTRQIKGEPRHVWLEVSHDDTVFVGHCADVADSLVSSYTLFQNKTATQCRISEDDGQSYGKISFRWITSSNEEILISLSLSLCLSCFKYSYLSICFFSFLRLLFTQYKVQRAAQVWSSQNEDV